MEWIIYNKIPKELFTDINVSAKLVSEMNKYEKLKMLLKSIRLINPVIQFGEDFNDFEKNLTSMVITYNAYKIPRIIKSHLLKKL
jgi:hypothetical protein